MTLVCDTNTQQYTYTVEQ